MKRALLPKKLVLRPLVSVIIVNWRKYRLLDRCIEKVFCSTYSPVEIIVIDNESDEGQLPRLRKKYKRAIFIPMKKNVGYAEANILGMKLSKGQYIVTLNNDVEVHKNWLLKAVDFLENNPCIGFISSKQLMNSCRSTIDSVGIGLTKCWEPINIGRGEKDVRQYDYPAEVFGAAGAAAIYRRKMLENTGFFDECYFAYNEEFDLAWRARLFGWKCIFLPQCIVYHDVSATADEVPNFRFFYGQRNRIYTLIKNLSLSTALVWFPYLAKYELRMCRFAFKTRGILMIYLKSRISVLGQMKTLIASRMKVQRKRVVSDDQIVRWMSEKLVRFCSSG